jgi:hypothetical protein
MSGISGGSFGGPPSVTVMQPSGGSENITMTDYENINDGTVHVLRVEIGTLGQRYLFDNGSVYTTSRAGGLTVTGLDVYGVFDNCRINNIAVFTIEDPFPATDAPTGDWHMRDDFNGVAGELMDRQPNVIEGFEPYAVPDGLVGTWAASWDDEAEVPAESFGLIVNGFGGCVVWGEGV